MNKIIKYIGIGVVLLLILDFGIKTFQTNQEYDKNNPITHEGKIKEGFEVDFETEKKLSDKSIELADKSMKDDENKQLVNSFNFCISVAEEMQSYECIANVISPTAYSHITNKKQSSEVGKDIYEYLTNGNTLSGLEVTNEVKENDNTQFILNVQVLEKRYPYKFKLSLKNKEIIQLTQVESEE